MSEEEIMALLRERLRLEVTTKSMYTGGMDGQPLYEDAHTVQLLLDGEIISEVDLT